MTVLTPVIFVVNQLSFLVLKLLRVDVKAKGESITEDELRTIVEVSHEEGVIESEEKKMINNVFEFWGRRGARCHASEGQHDVCGRGCDV